MGRGQTYAGLAVMLAVMLAAITLPGHVLGLRLPWVPPESHRHPSHAPDAVARSGAFVALAAAMSLAAFAVYPLCRQRRRVPKACARGFSMDHRNAS